MKRVKPNFFFKTRSEREYDEFEKREFQWIIFCFIFTALTLLNTFFIWGFVFCFGMIFYENYRYKRKIKRLNGDD